MPPVMRKRGRPKGHEVTVIGLPAKRSRDKQKHSDQKERVAGPFYQTSFFGQVVGLPARYISYFCSYVEVVWNDEVAIQVQRNKVLIEEEQVERSLVDENVDVEHFLQ